MRRLAAALLSVLAAAAAAGCGGDDAGGTGMRSPATTPPARISPSRVSSPAAEDVAGARVQCLRASGAFFLNTRAEAKQAEHGVRSWPLRGRRRDAGSTVYVWQAALDGLERRVYMVAHGTEPLLSASRAERAAIATIRGRSGSPPYAILFESATARSHAATDRSCGMPGATTRRAPPSRRDFRVPARAARGLHGIALWDLVTRAMVDPLGSLSPTQARSRLDAPQFVAWALASLATDIDHFDTFYASPGANYASVGVRLLRTVGAPRHAAVLDRANRAGWPDGRVPTIVATRSRAADEADLPFNTLDDAWLSAEHEDGPIEDLVAQYIRRHPAAFFVGG